MNWFQHQLYRPFFIRLLHWEYWNFNTVYFPIYIVWVGLCIRAKSFFFFAASNPTIKNGGFLSESKKEIFPILPREYCPATLFFRVPAAPEEVASQLLKNKMSFPLIGKPDIGSRGRCVKLLEDETALKAYIRNAVIDFHIQEFVPYKNEIGVFYYRYPDEQDGNLSGIVQKDFLKITGDGKSSMLQLINKSKRAILQMSVLQKLYGEGLSQVPAEREEIILVPYGNHFRGAMFLDDSHLIDKGLIKMIDSLCKKIPGFYFGRLDIRYNSWEELKAGCKFSIIELNGAGSEPTHIYDPKHSIFFAWKEIIRHWYILWKISRQNHRKGYPYLTLKQGIDMFKEDKEITKKLSLWME